MDTRASKFKIQKKQKKHTHTHTTLLCLILTTQQNPSWTQSKKLHIKDCLIA